MKVTQKHHYCTLSILAINCDLCIGLMQYFLENGWRVVVPFLAEWLTQPQIYFGGWILTMIPLLFLYSGEIV